MMYSTQQDVSDELREEILTEVYNGNVDFFNNKTMSERLSAIDAQTVAKKVFYGFIDRLKNKIKNPLNIKREVQFLNFIVDNVIVLTLGMFHVALILDNEPLVKKMFNNMVFNDISKRDILEFAYSPAMVEFLCKNGANVTLTNSYGHIPLVEFFTKYKSDELTLVQFLEIVQILKKYGADSNPLISGWSLKDMPLYTHLPELPTFFCAHDFAIIASVL